MVLHEHTISTLSYTVIHKLLALLIIKNMTNEPIEEELEKEMILQFQYARTVRACETNFEIRSSPNLFAGSQQSGPELLDINMHIFHNYF